MRVQFRARALKFKPFFDRKEDLANAEEPDDSDDKVEAFHQRGDAKGHAQLPGDDVETDRGENKSDEDRHKRLEGVAASETDKARKRQQLDGKKLWRPELQRDFGEQRGEGCDQHRGEQRPDEGRGERRRKRLAPLSLAGHWVTVEGGRDRPGFARNIKEDRCDGASEERSPVEAG